MQEAEGARLKVYTASDIEHRLDMLRAAKQELIARLDRKIEWYVDLKKDIQKL